MNYKIPTAIAERIAALAIVKGKKPTSWITEALLSEIAGCERILRIAWDKERKEYHEDYEKREPDWYYAD